MGSLEGLMHMPPSATRVPSIVSEMANRNTPVGVAHHDMCWAKSKQWFGRQRKLG